MKFEEFENIYVKENKKLRFVMGTIIIMLTVILFIIATNKSYFVLSHSKLVTPRPLLSWVCSESFMSIAKGKPEKSLITESILSELGKNEFKVSAEEVLSVLELKEDLCRIIVKGDGKIRSFLVNLEAHNEYPFRYKLTGITESELNMDELSKISEAK